MKILLAALALLVFAGYASADTIWDYQGNKMEPCGCAISGTFTVDTVQQFGTPLAWSFTDGTTTLNETDSTMHYYDYFGSGIFTTWHLTVSNSLGSFNMVFYGSAFEANDWDTFQSFSGNMSQHGTLETVSTAEPGTLALLGLGLAGLLARKRFQAKRNQVPAETVWEPLS